MSDNNNMDDILSEKIGSLGDTPKNTEEELGHQKLKYMSGDGLTQDEHKSMEAFLDRSRTAEDDQMGRTVDIMQGWIPINRAEMGMRSRFYNDTWQFRVRPATVEAIKNWSAIDEDENFYTVSKTLDEVLKSCLSIVSPEGNVGWNKIYDWDRLWFILKIREYTFAKGESKIEFEEECPNCDSIIKYEVRSQNLKFDLPDEDLVDKYWNPIERAWYINPKDFDVDYPTIKLYAPTLEKSNILLDYVVAQRQAGKQINGTFMKFLPWMLPKAARDEKRLETQIKEQKRIFDSWDINLFTFLNEVIRNISVTMSENIVSVCPDCGEEAQSEARFPMGIKSLFSVQNRHKKFGSK